MFIYAKNIRCIKIAIEIQFDSTWQDHTVKIMKTLHGFDNPVLNEEMGSIDYTIDEKEKKMLRVLLEGEKQTRYVQLVKQTMEEKEDNNIDEVFIVTKRLTKVARDIVTSDDSVSYLSPQLLNPFSLRELTFVIQEKLKELEEQIVDLVVLEETRFQIEVIKKNAKFHATMKWHDLVLEDLFQLLEIQNDLNKMEAQ